MSRIGKLPVKIPDGVEVKVDKNTVFVSGPKGKVQKYFPSDLSVDVSDDKIVVSIKKKTKHASAMYGTIRAIIANMVKGVSEGWSKSLELVGAGYRAEASQDTLTLMVGYSHPVKIKAPEGISFSVEKTDITVSGVDREVVGQTAAVIRKVRPPEPYKGKGIKYKDEEVRRKPGKAAKAQGAAA